MDSNTRLRQGISAAAGTALNILANRAQIESRNQYEAASTAIAGEIDRFNMDLDKDPDYQTYNDKWGKKLQELQKIIGEVKSPEAKRNVESFMMKVSETQDTTLKQKTENGLRLDSYVTRTNALNTRLQQSGIPTTVKMADIEYSVESLVQDGIIDRVKARDVSTALASGAIGQDLLNKASEVYKQVAAEQGPEAALNAADRYIADFNETYTVGGQSMGSTIQQKNTAQDNIRDVYNISTREAKAALEKQYTEQDNNLYGGYSAYINGDPKGLTFAAIDAAKLPVERKMYWRSQLEEAENARDRPDAAVEAQATEFWNKLTIYKAEMKRNNNALSGDVTIMLGGKPITFRDMDGLQEAVRSNHALLSKVFGKAYGKMYEDFIGDIDKPVGVIDATKDRILAQTKEKKNPMPAWEAAEFNMMFDAYSKSLGGKVSLEQADEWYKNTVLKPKIDKLVKNIGYGAWIADNDDIITQGLSNGEFKYDIADGRPTNPRTKDALLSWAAAFEKEYSKADDVKAGKDFSASWNSGGKGTPFFFRRELKDTVETVAPLPFGASKESNLVKFTYDKQNKLINIQAYDVKDKKWKPAQPRLNDNKTYDFTPDVQAKAREAVKEKRTEDINKQKDAYDFRPESLKKKTENTFNVSDYNNAGVGAF